MGAFYGSTPGLDFTRQMHVSWSLITVGSSNPLESLQQANATEMFVIDDNDGNLANGTPNHSRICAAITAHGGGVLTCPTITQQSCYANCDASTTAPVLNANDFNCFLNKFAAGCT